MHSRPTRPPTKAVHRTVCALAAAVSIGVSSCDIGDGTTLKDPVAPTTTTIDTTPLPSVPLADSVLVGSIPTDEVPADEIAVEPGATDEIPAESTIATDTAVPAFEVTAPWADGGVIDPGFTCDGAGQIPIVTWTGVPEGTVELAVSLVDEARPSEAGPFVHWAVAGIDPAVGQLLPGELPPGAFEAVNVFGDVGYGPPCPDPGTTGVYVLRLFAVGQQVESGFDVPAVDLLGIVESVSFAVATSSGEYTR